VRLVLDTNALWSRQLVTALFEAATTGRTTDGTIEVVLPAVAYAERVRQLRRDGRDVARWKADLVRMGVSVECFCAEQADELEGVADPTWGADGRDHLIAAHAREGGTVVTDDRGAGFSRARRIGTAEAAMLIQEAIGDL